MSIAPVTFSRVICDSCGIAEYLASAPGAFAARIEASAKGWKFAEYQVRGLGLNKYAKNPRERGYTVPKQWDCCPDCPVPPDAKAAAEIRDARNGRQ